ncbi:hypothetical protein ACFW08_05625 [Streptomyces sp. NPDC058960]|uniref:DUF7448 domain-containing protein n=1 Tax=Streptomyces sp. NPDC058960 TaxID=3346679 RepID=UPI00369FC58D
MTMYADEVLSDFDDDGTMPENVDELRKAVVGHRIVKAEAGVKTTDKWGYRVTAPLVLTLDNGKRVELRNTDDCCAYTELESFLLHPDRVDHIITGVGTTDGYTTWHIYADMGDVLELSVGWSSGNPFYYAYGFDISVTELTDGEQLRESTYGAPRVVSADITVS